MKSEQMIESAKVLCATGSPDSVRASMIVLKATNDLAQAEMISIFEKAQKDLINELVRLTTRDLVTYHIEAALERVTQILNKMKGESVSVAEILVKSNVITGKLSSKLKTAKKPKDFVSAFDLTGTDTSNVERLVGQLTANIINAANAAEQSVRAQLQTACVKAQTNKDTNADIKVDFPSMQNGNIQTQTYRISIEKPAKLTKQEQDELDKNPLKAAKKIASDAYKMIAFMRNQYMIGRREADLVRQKTLQAVAQNEAYGGGMINAKKELIESLMNEGLVAFVDRSGRRWTLGNYCNMAVRTTSRQSTNLGELFDDPEQDLYIIVDRKSTCPICAKYEGRVYSRSGTNPNYPALHEAFSKIDPNGGDGIENTYLTIHPNCRHTLAAWVERAHTPKQIESVRNKSNPETNPFNKEQRNQEEIERYKKRELVMSQEAASVRKYREFMQYIPVKILGSWITFHKHYMAKDGRYDELKKMYSERKNSK